MISCTLTLAEQVNLWGILYNFQLRKPNFLQARAKTLTRSSYSIPFLFSARLHITNRPIFFHHSYIKKKNPSLSPLKAASLTLFTQSIYSIAMPAKTLHAQSLFFQINKVILASCQSPTYPYTNKVIFISSSLGKSKAKNVFWAPRPFPGKTWPSGVNTSSRNNLRGAVKENL